MKKIAPKTTWCQVCIEDRDKLYMLEWYPGQINWVCEKCYREWERISALKPKTTKEPTKEELKQWARCKELMKDRSLQIRKLKPGETLPNVRTDFSRHCVPLRSKPNSYDLLSENASYDFEHKNDK